MHGWAQEVYLTHRQCVRVCRAVFGSEHDPYSRHLLRLLEQHIRPPGRHHRHSMSSRAADVRQVGTTSSDRQAGRSDRRGISICCCYNYLLHVCGPDSRAVHRHGIACHTRVRQAGAVGGQRIEVHQFLLLAVESYHGGGQADLEEEEEDPFPVLPPGAHATTARRRAGSSSSSGGGASNANRKPPRQQARQQQKPPVAEEGDESGPLLLDPVHQQSEPELRDRRQPPVSLPYDHHQLQQQETEPEVRACLLVLLLLSFLPPSTFLRDPYTCPAPPPPSAGRWCPPSSTTARRACRAAASSTRASLARLLLGP